jgi:hypothetical protein
LKIVHVTANFSLMNPGTPASVGGMAGETVRQDGRASRRSKWALAAFIAGVFGWTGIGAVVAISCGVIALLQIRRSSGQIVGLGRAWVGMVLGITLLVPVLIGALTAQNYAGVVRRMWLIRSTGEALRSYARDHGGLVPPADSWTTAITPYLREISKERNDPGLLQATNRYCLNATVAGRVLDQVPLDVVLLFELESPASNIAARAFGDAQSTSAPRSSRGRFLITFVDGHSEVVPTNRFPNLRWNP